MAYKALFVGSSPRDAAHVQTGKEFDEIRKATEAGRKDIQWDSINDRPLGSIIDRIQTFSPNIIHFSGHGHPKGELAFVNEHGQSQTATPDTVETLFASLRVAKRKVECVVINACHSDQMAWAIAQHCEYIIAVHGEVADQNAVEFSSRFYKSWIINKMPLLEAFRTSSTIIRVQSGMTPYILTGNSVPHDFSETAQNSILYYFSKLIGETAQPAKTPEAIMIYLREKTPSRVDVLAIDCFDECRIQLSLQRDEQRRAIAEPRATEREVFFELQESISFFNTIISEEPLFPVALLDPKKKAIRRRWNKAAIESHVYHMETPPYLTLTLKVPRYR